MRPDGDPPQRPRRWCRLDPAAAQLLLLAGPGALFGLALVAASRTGPRVGLQALAVEPIDTTGLDVAALLASADAPMMMGILVVALLRRWLVLPREVDDRDRIIVKLEAERDEYKSMALRAVGLTERVVSATERGGP